MTVKTTQFQSLDSAKAAVKAEATIELGQPSYVQFIEHPIVAHNDYISSVTVGSHSGTSTLYPELAENVDSFLAKMDNFIESGEVERIDSIDLLVVDKKYRLYVETESDTHSVDFENIADFDKYLGEITAH